MNEPKAVAEIHAIREQTSKEIANLTPKERVERVKYSSQNLLKKYGIELKTAVK